MLEHDAGIRGALQPHGGDVIGIPDHHRLGAGDARVRRPGRERDGDAGILDARAEHGHEGQGQHEAREGQENIGDAHQDAVGPAAEIARDGADQEPDRADRDHDQQHNDERDARAMHDAREDVAAQRIRSEPVLRRGREQALVEVLRERIMRRDERCKGCGQQQYHHDRKASQSQRIGLQRKPAPIGLRKARLSARGGRFGGEVGVKAAHATLLTALAGRGCAPAGLSAG